MSPFLSALIAKYSPENEQRIYMRTFWILPQKCQVIFKCITGFLVLWQNNFSKMSSAQHTKQTKWIDGESTLLRYWLLTLRIKRIVFVLQIASDLRTSILCGSCVGRNCRWYIGYIWQLRIYLLWCCWLLHYWLLWHVLSIIVYVQIIERLNDLQKLQKKENVILIFFLNATKKRFSYLLKWKHSTETRLRTNFIHIYVESFGNSSDDITNQDRMHTIFFRYEWNIHLGFTTFICGETMTDWLWLLVDLLTASIDC